MSPEQQTKADAILRDAADVSVPKQKVLHAMSELGQRELSGDERLLLVDRVYALLAERDAEPGNNLFATHSTF